MWYDVKKHCNSHHSLDIDTKLGLGGCAMGLTELDKSRGKPMYAFLKSEDIYLYPLCTDILD